MIEVGKRYKLKASAREIEVLSASRSQRHITIRYIGDPRKEEYRVATDDVEKEVCPNSFVEAIAPMTKAFIKGWWELSKKQDEIWNRFLK